MLGSRVGRAAALVAAAARPAAERSRTSSIPDEPADKLYNEGLYLLQSKSDSKAAAKKFEEVDRQHPVFGLGAQGAAS